MHFPGRVIRTMQMCHVTHVTFKMSWSAHLVTVYSFGLVHEITSTAECSLYIVYFRRRLLKWMGRGKNRKNLVIVAFFVSSWTRLISRFCGGEALFSGGTARRHRYETSDGCYPSILSVCAGYFFSVSFSTQRRE